jgi:hypothetical protein
MINIRKKFKSIIEENNEWQWVVIRHLSNNRCTCISQPAMIYNDEKHFDEINKSFRTIPNPDCNLCGGAGFLYEEFLYKGLLFFPGFRIAHFEDAGFATTEQNVLTVYLNSTSETDIIRANDIVFNVESGYNGELVHPIKRVKKWIINDRQPIRLDHNKFEYLKLYAKPAIL